MRVPEEVQEAARESRTRWWLQEWRREPLKTNKETSETTINSVEMEEMVTFESRYNAHHNNHTEYTSAE